MAEQILRTTIALKIKTLQEWTDNYPNYKPRRGEVCLCEIPTGNANATTAPTVLFKVGDGESTFSQLKWASALAADVYAWAKKSEAEFKTWVKTLVTVEDIDLSNYYNKTEVDQLLANNSQADQAYADGKANAAKNAAISTAAADATEKANTAESNAKGYADQEVAKALGTAKTYADGKASAAETNAKGYADGIVAETLNAAKSYADGKANTAETNAKSYADGIVAAEKTRAEAAEAKALNDAKAYTDQVKAGILGEGISETFDTLKEIEEWINGEGVNATELTQAIATETKNRQDADKALGERIDGVVQTHSTDKENLEKAIAAGDTATLKSAKDYTDAEVLKDRNRIAELEAHDEDYIAADSALKAELQKEIDDDVKALADGQVNTNKEAIAAINHTTTGILATAKNYADGLASNYATAAQGTKADNALQSVEVGAGLKITEKSGNKQAISFDPDCVFILDCN